MASLTVGGSEGAAATTPRYKFFHGTSIDAAMSIQASGFKVSLSGSNAGALLGPGVYCTTDLEKVTIPPPPC